MTADELEALFIGFAIAGAGLVFVGVMVALGRWLRRRRP
jgi:hypothetical protein